MHAFWKYIGTLLSTKALANHVVHIIGATNLTASLAGSRLLTILPELTKSEVIVPIERSRAGSHVLAMYFDIERFELWAAARREHVAEANRSDLVGQAHRKYVDIAYSIGGPFGAYSNSSSLIRIATAIIESIIALPELERRRSASPRPISPVPHPPHSPNLGARPRGSSFAPQLSLPPLHFK